jgi:hypothetical protein
MMIEIYRLGATHNEKYIDAAPVPMKDETALPHAYNAPAKEHKRKKQHSL